MNEPTVNKFPAHADEKDLRSWLETLMDEKLSLGEKVAALTSNVKHRITQSQKISKHWVEPELPPYAKIKEIARSVGYCIAEHGSQRRDYDLVACPWTAQAVGAQALIDALAIGLDANQIGGIEERPHGRKTCILQLRHKYAKHIDLSIMPRSGDAS